MFDTVEKDQCDHRGVAGDTDFSIALLVPLPFYVAAKQLALKHGVHIESWLLSMASNITFLENHLSRLGADPGEAGQIVAKNAGHRLRPDALEANSQQPPCKRQRVDASLPLGGVVVKQEEEPNEAVVAAAPLAQVLPALQDSTENQ